jgi:outer membrane biosynthesis protein TonB
MVSGARSRSWSLFIGCSVASAAVVMSVACGGGKADGGAPKTPEPSGSASGDGTSSSAAPGGGGGGDTGGTTTTTALGDGGDLQGAKLSSSSKKEIETKGDAGAKPPPGGEPGRKREDIQAIVMARRDEARACYDKALKDHPGIEGDLDVKFLIDPTGAVTEAEVDHSKSTIHEDAVGKCVVDVIKKIKFNKSDKGFETRAHYPFNFHPKNAPSGKDAGK